MTNTMVRDIELDELEIVSGGTVTELEELLRAYMTVSTSGEPITFSGGHLPGLNYASAGTMEEVLEHDFGVIADIDLGFCGLGINSDPNTYKDKITGQSLTHAQVIRRIKDRFS